jgi:tetratricopeptide (TPR) repeat protein
VHTYHNLGVIHARQRAFAEAEPAFRRALDLSTNLAARPESPHSRSGPGPQLYQSLATLLSDTGRLGEAEELFGRVLGYREQLVADFPNVPEHRERLAHTLYLLADLRLRLNKFEEARRGVERALGYQLALCAADPQNPAGRRNLRHHYSTLAKALVHLGEHREAAAVAVKLPPLYPDGWEERLSAGWFLALCVPLAERDARLTAAERQALRRDYADRAVRFLREAVQRGYKNVAFLRENPELEPLRARPDFQDLLRALSAPTPAAAASARPPGKD